MSADDRFTRALARLVHSDDQGVLPDHVARACTAALDVEGAGLSYTLLPDRRLPLGASDPEAAAAERLQYATGEGPCLSAQRQRAMVLAPLAVLIERWPVFTAQLQAQTPYRSVVALPVGGPLAGVVALDLYRRDPDSPDPQALQDIEDVAGLVGRALVDDLAGDEDLVLGLPASFRTLPIAARHRVWLAIGHLSAQRAVPTSAALALLRAAAFAGGLDLETTANRILSGELPTPDRDPAGT